MSRIPSEIKMRTVTFGDGAKGMAFQIDNDTENLGVSCEARRKDGRSPFVSTWRYRWLPDRTFATFGELCVIVNALAESVIEAEKGRWPKPYETDREPSQNKCWLDGVAGSTLVTVRTSWHEYDSAPLCPACAAKAKDDPTVVVRAVEAREAQVRQRHAIGTT